DDLMCERAPRSPCRIRGRHRMLNRTEPTLQRLLAAVQASAIGCLLIAHGRICWVQIGMLGSFEVRTDDGAFVDVPGARLRGLLIALALEPGHAVPKATLVGWIWGEHPPADATNALHRLVSRLRKALPEGSVEGLRLRALEGRFDAEVSVGHGAELVTELTDLVAAHPVRERLVAALMRALVAAGRDTEALLVYERTREALADALGVDPSPELSALHVALLRGELGRREQRWQEEGRKT